MTLSISISRQAELNLKAKAAVAGVDVETYASKCLERLALPSRTVEEISGPIGESFARSGMSEDELSKFLEGEKHEMRAKRRAASGE